MVILSPFKLTVKISITGFSEAISENILERASSSVGYSTSRTSYKVDRNSAQCLCLQAPGVRGLDWVKDSLFLGTSPVMRTQRSAPLSPRQGLSSLRLTSSLYSH